MEQNTTTFSAKEARHLTFDSLTKENVFRYWRIYNSQCIIEECLKGKFETKLLLFDNYKLVEEFRDLGFKVTRHWFWSFFDGDWWDVSWE